MVVTGGEVLSAATKKVYAHTYRWFIAYSHVDTRNPDPNPNPNPNTLTLTLTLTP